MLQSLAFSASRVAEMQACVQTLLRLHAQRPAFNAPTRRFFHTYKDFARERLVLAHPRLHTLLPPAHTVVENLDAHDPAGIVEAPSGHRLPSFIALERGASLAQWRARAAPPLGRAAALYMIRAVTALAATLHAAGRAHRNVQPETVLHLPQTQAWRLSDLGACAPLGALTLQSRTAARDGRFVVAACWNGVPRCSSWWLRYPCARLQTCQGPSCGRSINGRRASRSSCRRTQEGAAAHRPRVCAAGSGACV